MASPFNIFVSINRKSTENCLYLASISSSFSNGCTDNIIRKSVCLCLSSNIPYSQNITIYLTVSLPNYSNGSSVAKKTLVHRATTILISPSVKIPIRDDLLHQPKTQIYHPQQGRSLLCYSTEAGGLIKLFEFTVIVLFLLSIISVT